MAKRMDKIKIDGQNVHHNSPSPKYIAHWFRGNYALCIGDWTLFKSTVDPATGEVKTEDITDLIPKDFRQEPMYTYGTYSEYYFGDHMEVMRRDYEDGLEEDEWIEKNKDWLDGIVEEPEDYGLLFKAF